MACLCDEREGAAIFEVSRSLLDAVDIRFGRGTDGVGPVGVISDWFDIGVFGENPEKNTRLSARIQRESSEKQDPQERSGYE